MTQPIYLIESTKHVYAGSGAYTSKTTIDTAYGWFFDDEGARDVAAELEGEARAAHQSYNAQAAAARNNLIASSERLNEALREAHDTDECPQVSVPPVAEPLSFEEFCRDFGYTMFRDVALRAGNL